MVPNLVFRPTSAPKCHLPSRGISEGGVISAAARFKRFDSDSWSWLKEAQ